MENVKIIVLVILLALIMSCSSDKIADNIIGKWQIININIQSDIQEHRDVSINSLVKMINNGEITITTEYRKNGEYISEFEYNDGDIKSIYSRGIYHINEDKREIVRTEKYNFNEDNLSLVESQDTDELKIQVVSITNSKLIINSYKEGVYTNETLKKQ